MQAIQLLKSCLSALALLSTVSASHGVVRIWNGTVSTDANNASNWSSNALPTASDLALVMLPSNNRLPVLTANMTVGGLSVQPNASITTDVYALAIVDSCSVAGGLEVAATGSVIVSRLTSSPFTGGILKVTGGGIHQINGLVDVRGVMWIDSNNATLQGSGNIKLNNSSARMDISNGLTATFRMKVEGRGTIQPASGSATFVLAANSTYMGVVDANANGTLAFTAGMTVIDSSANGVLPLFRASTSPSATLRFNSDALSLVSDFEIVDCATLDLQCTIYTSGSLLTFEGCIYVGGEYFQLDGSFDLFGPGAHCNGDC